MKRIVPLLVFVCLLAVIAVVNSCKKEPVPPTLTTNDAVTNITINSATSGGVITKDGGAAVSARGVCWSTSAGPTISDSHSSDATGIGSFVSNITDLTPNTLYHVRAYATNKAGTAYGNEVTFTSTPIVVPTVVTTAATSITVTTAVTGGNVTADGYATVTARGVCWSLTTGPTITNDKTSDGTGTGIFVSNLTGLTPGVTYYIRAYATNSAGTGYGNELTFTTTTPLGAPTIGTATKGNGQATVTFTAPVNDGGSPITGYTVTSNPGGITATGTASPITVTGLTNGTAYTFTVIATNANGNSPASAASNSVTPSAVPGAPAIGTATTGNAQATVTFTAPSNSGGLPITGYTVTSNPGGIIGTGTTSPVTVTGLTNGTAYTFTVTATNANGTGLPSAASNSVTPSTVPGAPTIGTATKGNAQATVAFTAPANNGGSAITGYTITSNPGGMTATGISSPLTVTGLTNGTAYTFTVVATNVNGNSLASAASNSITPSAGPGVPTIGTATKGNAQATVTFTAPASDGGSPITGYTVTSNPGGFTATGAASPLTVTGLTNGTAYTFTVFATNANGNSAPSSASNSVTPSTVPGAPTIGTATKGNAQATIAFTAPASNGGSVITGYTVTSTPGNFTATGAASPLTVTGLTNGTAYTFTVIATNANGNSVASSASNSVTPSTVPGAPTIGTALKGNTQAEVAFTAPANNGGSAITSYTATSNPGGFTATAASSPITVTGLTNGTAYTFTVIATNANGNSTASSASNSVTPSSVPGAPTIGTATEGNAQASVSFTAPVSDGGSPITGYTVTSNPGGLTGTGTVSPVTVTGLTNGTLYTFSVVATNSSGNSLPSAASNSIRPHTATTVYDVEGNLYNIVTIGTQTWMKENLKTTKYNNGNDIGTTTTTSDLSLVTTPKFVWAFNDDEANVATYGRLYTFYAVTDARGVCPAGYHVPSVTDWATLHDYLTVNNFGFTAGADDIAKALANTSGWPADPTPGNPGNDQASNNSSGFSALPSGYRRGVNGTWFELGSKGYWGSSSEGNTPGSSSWYRNVDYNVSILGLNDYGPWNGYAIRCVK